MRVVHVVTLIADNGAFGGPMRVALNHVQELRRRGHDTDLVAGWSGPRPIPQCIDGIPVRAFRARQVVPGSGFSGLHSPGLRRWLQDALPGTDVIHVHAGRDLISLGALATASSSSCPAVVQTHGMIGVDRRIRARLVDRLAVRRLVGGAASQLVLTDREEGDLPIALERRLRMTRIPNGVPSPLPGAEVTHESSNVLYCARLHERKRPLAFIEMAALVTNLTASFSIVGPDEGQLRQVLSRIADLGISDRIDYEGSLPYDQVQARMRSAGIYVLPSVDEPFPMSLLEAMSLGLACVCTDSCGISADIATAGAAIVTDGAPTSLAAAVDMLLDDTERRIALGRRAQAMVRDAYSIAAVVDILESVYESARTDYARERLA